MGGKSTIHSSISNESTCLKLDTSLFSYVSASSPSSLCRRHGKFSEAARAAVYRVGKFDENPKVAKERW